LEAMILEAMVLAAASLGVPPLVHRFHETDHMWGIHNFRRGF
jgi:hypothetical protein